MMAAHLMTLEDDATKHEVLAAIVPQSALDELQELRREGIALERGVTDDPAYDSPQAIRDTFVQLHRYGLQYQREVGRLRLMLARAAAAASAAPFRPVRTWGKHWARAHRAHTERVRGRIMYDQPEVQGQPWHRQNGRATALVTIVDALDIITIDSNGIHNRVSGRLDPSLLTLRFGDRTGWLEHLTVEEATAEAAMRFRGWTSDRAASFATAEMAEVRTFVTSKSQPGFKQIVGYCIDSLGIRSRKEEVRQEVHRHVEQAGRSDLLMLSIGCGTALPMLEVLESLRRSGRNGHLILVDQDPIALASAQLLAQQLGLEEAVEIHCERLILGRGASTQLLDLDTVLQGRLVDVCEDSGLREYFPDFLYVDLATKAWNATMPGGLVTTSNMNTNRPQPEFLSGMMGWPIPVQMRTARQVHDLHLKAGVPSELLRLRLTQEAVYTLCFISKPL